ncbi:unnamed protein product, partial [Thelazia callipaeda]|uniref:Sulfate_transp domain-containing protein n=1 Tax=Thelazia callipaeda TaxID=103827 RepID=A0A0N5CNL1_THECL
TCYDPYIACNESIGHYQYHSKCYDVNPKTSKIAQNLTWEQIVIAMTSSSEALRDLPPNIFLKEKINNPESPSEFFIASATIEQAIIAVIAILGIRIYAKIARFTVIFPQLCMVICICFAVTKAGFQTTVSAIAEGFLPDLEEFFTLRTWAMAALQVQFNLIKLLLQKFG